MMKFEQAKEEVLKLESGVKAFEADCGRYPTTDEGLEALSSAPAGLKSWNGPYLKHPIVNDPWGNPYMYTSPTSRKDSFLIESYGADGKPGGDGVAADIKDEGDGIRENKGY
jgi:general secretion pathway protein G